MAEGAEVEERVDLDEDNYMEEMDDDVEEQIDEDGVDGVDGGSDENVEENAEEAHEDPTTKTSEKDQSPEPDESHNAGEFVDNEEKPSASVNEEEKEKHAQLLALPPYGSEVFIGGLPKDTLEEDLRDLCDEIGEIIEIRLMQDRETGESKGYAFIGFKTKEVAQKAIEELHNKAFKGKTLRCSLSETKHRLFIGNVPKIWTEDEFRKVIEEVGPGIEHIELIKVKALYVKNIPENTSTEKLKELFQRHGEVTKVVMPPGKGGQGKRDFGFVHFAERSSALKAVKDTEKYEIDGQPLEVVLAKPQTEKKSDGAYPYNAGPHANHLPHPGYGGGFAGNPYGSVGAGYSVPAGFQQPMIYGRGPMPAGMHMVPMVLPDGRIGYVLQQPGGQIPTPRPRRVDRSNGPSGQPGRGGGGSDESNRGRRYRPY
ncbi:heterogeneous nuclear ribonucleoprotein R [Prunus yedoensis var. nudiflora]|uniref:Heterogeneous nuclear ribonucleoprotein R n=1 Tax=Prunus yedoensis var. nudiflora TaxID=2094558 RepID=A0A314ZU69_PRUYE|nr:heterogeneous nuclear ribonucleoprotein R [Prunus yedoensis var. nudiflora]